MITSLLPISNTLLLRFSNVSTPILTASSGPNCSAQRCNISATCLDIASIGKDAFDRIKPFTILVLIACKAGIN